MTLLSSIIGGDALLLMFPFILGGLVIAAGFAYRRIRARFRR